MEEAFAVRRVALSAGVRTPIMPPVDCAGVQIGNAAPISEMRVYTHATDATAYLGIAAGFNYVIQSLGKRTMSRDRVAFWLECDTAETAVLVWLA